MSKGYILRKGSASLNDLIDGYGSVFATANKVFHVEHYHENASDSNEGDNPTKPMMTIAGAYGRCEDGRGDVILIKGFYRYREAELVIEKDAIQFFGAGWGTQWNRTSSQAGDYVAKIHGASGVGLRNMQLSGTDLSEDVIYCGEGDTGSSPAHCVIEDCLIRGAWWTANPSGTCKGITLVSPTFMKIRNNFLYACGIGIDLADGSEKTCHAMLIENNKINCGSYGVKWNTAYGYTSEINDNIIWDWSSTVNMTFGISLSVSTGGILVCNNTLGCANPAYDLGDLNYWVGNKVRTAEAASELQAVAMGEFDKITSHE